VFVEGGLKDQKYGLSHLYEYTPDGIKKPVIRRKPKTPLTDYVLSESKDTLALQF
jgi:hypothetical protein